MVDKLANVKKLFEGTVYPAIRLRNAIGDMPHVSSLLGEEVTAYVDMLNDLGVAIRRDDPNWRGLDMTGPLTEASDNVTAKALYKRLERDATAIRRLGPYFEGPTRRQLVVFGQESVPPEDCFMTRLRDAILLDDPSWTP